MPRQRRSAAPRSAPARPTPAARSNPAPSQSRSMTTTAPAGTRSQPPAQSQGQAPGLFGQMASTAAGVAVGSSIGHAIGGMFGGGQAAPAEEYQTNASDPQSSQQSNNSWGAGNCEGSAMQFTKCMDDNNGNLQICNWYLDQLKACQAAAREF